MGYFGPNLGKATDSVTNDNEKGWWVAWKPKRDKLRINERPGLAMVVGDTLYHNGGITHMTWDPNLLEVLHDFGVMTCDEAFDEFDIETKFAELFPPKSASPRVCYAESCGWISPDGKGYPCRYSQHKSLAARICKMLGLEIQEWSWLTSVEDTLIKERWMRYGPSLIIVDHDRPPSLAFTTAQMKFLKKMLAAKDKVKDSEKCEPDGVYKELDTAIAEFVEEFS